MAILLTVGGSMLIILLVVDVFLTVFHSQGRGGPINRRLSRSLWTVLRSIGRRGDGSAGEGVLGFGGPLMVVSTLGLWVFLLVSGFTLIYYPWIQGFLVSPGELRTPWLEAIYYSSYTAATLGFGDVIADTESLRLLTVLQAFGGFALLSASLSYFTSVYRELIAMQSLASNISSLFCKGEAAVLEFAEAEGYEPIARWCEELSGGLSRVLLAHFQYPVLHYFRPDIRSRALPVQLGVLLRLQRLVERQTGSRAIAVLARHPSYLALMDTLETYLSDIDRLFVPANAATPSAAGPASERAHSRLTAYMLYS